MSRYKEEYKPTIKDILIENAPDDETKEYIEKLTSVEDQTDFNNLTNSNKNIKNIITKYPKFIIHPSNHNRSYNYKKWLNKKTSQFQPKGDLYDLIKSFKGVPEDQDLDEEKITQINQWIKEEIGKNEAEYIEQEKEELTRNIRAGSYQNANEKLSKQKNENEELKKKLKKKDEETRSIINERWKGYIRDHYIIDAPQTREELINKLARDKYLKTDTEEDIKKYVDYILEKQLNRLITSKTKIIKTAKLFGNDAAYLSKLDPMVREAVLKYQTDMINKTITDKNNKYLLPKKYIKFEKAINDYKVNPLILRGLYVK